MELEQRTLRVSTVVIVCAIVLRLLSGGILEPVTQALSSSQVSSFLLFLGTGRVIRLTEPELPTQAPTVPTQAGETEPTEPPTDAPTQPPVTLPVFAPEDAALIEVNNYCGYQADIPALLQQPLSWDLTDQAPAVLIVHSHGSESYTKTESYTESSGYRTLDTRYNVVSVGDRIAEILEAGGIRVIHDRTLHDYPSYNGSYDNSRAAIADYLKQYPSIRMVLDIHRDAMTDSTGKQVGTTVSTGTGSAAQLMMVVGTDAGGLKHPQWQTNMALAVKLHVQLEKQTPGICRPISFRSQRFNQDLSAGGMLIEIGAAGNTRQEALVAAELLAQGILTLARGTADVV